MAFAAGIGRFEPQRNPQLAVATDNGRDEPDSAVHHFRRSRARSPLSVFAELERHAQQKIPTAASTISTPSPDAPTLRPDAAWRSRFRANGKAEQHDLPHSHADVRHGLIETISEATIYANMAANSQLNIARHQRPSQRERNDGTVTRFGWKAQNKSVEIFAGEAYNVEMGVTNELFPEERGTPPANCMSNATPEDSTNFPRRARAIPSDTVAFANFMRFLAPPAPSSVGIPGNPSAQSIADGAAMFNQVHCNMCHTQTLVTGNSVFTSGLSNQNANLYSDLLVHNMGSGLADNISQGAAGPMNFAPRRCGEWGSATTSCTTGARHRRMAAS